MVDVMMRALSVCVRWNVSGRLVAIVCMALAAAIQAVDANGQTTAAVQRPRIGVALGGGSARGLAHVGVLRWLEEHRIPIDRVAGTSMGGLIGASYATGMTPDEIETMLADIDWNAMFEDSDFQFQTVRRKRDSRAYPAHLEFGLKNGLAAQSSLNSGQQVELLFRRVTAPYYGVRTFDELPTPFRSVAFDLPTSQRIVLDSGSLAQALRATMSLPSVFPPVAIGDKLLVDGGAIDNVPADVVRDMGAERVIAVNVGDLTEQRAISTSLLGVVGSTLDAMMRVNTLKGMAAADVVVNVPLTKYGSLDWRRFRDLIREGYNAAEAMKTELMPLAVDETAWESWRSARAAARRRALPAPAFITVEGAGSTDTAVMERALAPHLGKPVDVAALDKTLTGFGGLGRYEALTWDLAERDGMTGLVVRALPKLYAPPFLFLAVSLENTTSNTFQFGLGARYLAYDIVGSGSELRVDGAIGSNPSAGVALYRPLGSTAFFIEPSAGVGSQKLSVIEDHEIVASYGEIVTFLGADVGMNIGATHEARAGVRWGHVSTDVEVGDPGFPEIDGNEGLFHLSWTHDSQDHQVIPRRGLNAVMQARYFFDAPVPEVETDRSSDGVAQAQAGASWFWSLDRGARNRLFVAGGAGTSFRDHPLPTDQFVLGGPLRLSALDIGEQRGDNFLLATGGYLRQIARLPDFLGSAVLAGGWIENGSAFDDWASRDFQTNVSGGMIADTLIGPVFVSIGAGFDGSKRFYIGIGQIFR
jgi:NTE family protein